jgi:hypothetical protein
MTTVNVARRSVAENLSDILNSPEVSRLIDELQQTRDTGRPGYPLRAMIGMALAKSLYALPCWTRVVRLVREHPALAAVIAPDGDVPSQWACYRFTAKLRAHTNLLETCIASVVKELKRRNPLLGWDVAIDASDMPAYANGQRFKSKGGEERKKFSDPDASWGHRSAVSTRKGGGFYGYRLHMAVCSKTDLRSRGESRRRATTKRCPSRRCWTSCTLSGSTRRRRRSTRATTTTGSTRTAPSAGSPGDPAPADPGCQEGKGQAALLRAWRVALRRG